MADLSQDQQLTQSKPEGASPAPEESTEVKLSSLGIKSPGKPSKKAKIVLSVLALFFILASIPAAVYLVKQRQEIRKEAGFVGTKDRCTDVSCEVTIGPDNLSFATAGHGTRNTRTPTINLNIPSGSTVYKAYAIWGGERDDSTPKDNNFNISVNSGSSQSVVGNLATYTTSATGTLWDAFLADITSLLPTNATNFSFQIVSGFLEGDYEDEGGGGAGHGISIIVVYKNSANPYSKIKIKLWGGFILRNTSDTMVFNLDELDTSETSSIKVAFFFGEGEGTITDEVRPNYLYYVENGNQKLEPTDGTPYPAYGSDPGFWWDTRITGDDLPAINALGGQASFYVVSPSEAEDPQGRRGDSLVWHGGTIAYAVTPPAVLQCLDLAGDPDPSSLSPGDEITLACSGSSDSSAPIHHFEFRMAIDSGEPVDLGSAEAVDQAQIIYTIPDYGSYQAECRACTSSDSSECTEWGQAQ